MTLAGLAPLLLEDAAVRELVAAADSRPREPRDVLVPVGVRPPLLAAVAQASHLVTVVTATTREAEDLVAALRCYLSDDEVATFPAWETLPHERLSPGSDTVARRLAVLRRLAHPGSRPGTGPIRALVVPVRALLQPVIAGLGELEPVTVAPGDRVDLAELSQRLTDAAYTRVDLVSRRGEFAVRGGILDVFPPTEDHPLRLELWGEDVEEIRWFAVADQRSLEPAPGLWAPPCRELLLTPEVRDRAAGLVDRLPGAAEMLTKIAAGIAVEGMESLTPLLVPELVDLVNLVPECLLVVHDPERVRRRAHDLLETDAEFLAAAWSAAAGGGQVPIDLERASFADYGDTRQRAIARGLGWWTFAAFALDEPEGEDGRPFRDVRRYHGDVPRAIADLQRLQRDGWRLVLTTEGPGSAQRMAEQLGANDVPARLTPQLTELDTGVVHVVPAAVGAGFVAEGLRLALFTELDLTGRPGASTRDMRALPSRRRRGVDPLQLRAGDFVVHEQHGVARFVELTQRTVAAGPVRGTREYLVLEYAPSKRGQPADRLYLPTDQLDQVTKYVGGETPALNRLGGADWARTKGRARKAVREIAAELIRLYSARMATPGHAFGPDTPWQRELEDAFPYVETPDQLVTIDEVKADMGEPVPMDRLICGDVGYGKTEIAVRAAFKAVQDGKQVAVLVPTTLLVQQHLETFTQRYAPFPVRVRALSRFSTAAEAREVVDGLAKGAVDVVIGTHRLLTGLVRFKDLGLVVVDEEQRFGVEHKETLKALRTDVDVLAMSATPIPRTLEMAVTGIREMSTLATPPEARHPVLTFVGPYDDKQVVAAIRRELLRDGQVFFVHNRVASIDRVATRLAELVPEARISAAHGQMGEHRLEQVMIDFWEKRSDVLVCTTIVETGLDISNANTLIVDRADLLGLSQLHQLRGRVGRGRERAYAYFMYPGDRPLTETAYDRLATIAANTDLGAGMQVALKDLEIRGSGNLLGSEQSGHIAGVGFDLYVRMVAEAVSEFRGQGEVEAEVRLELPVDAHVPSSYIDSERLRLEAYRMVAEARTDTALEEAAAALTDRYGPLPEPVANLIHVGRVRNRARSVGLTELAVQGKYLRLAPVEVAESVQLRLKRLHPGTVLKPAVRTALVPLPPAGRPLLEWVGTLLGTISGAA